MRDVTILVTSAGRRVGLLNCLRDSARQLGLQCRILSADFAPELSAASQVADKAFKVPSVSAPDYIAALIDICKRERVALLVPTIDPELEPLARSRLEFAALGTFVNISSLSVVETVGDKLATAQVLAAHGILVPQSWAWPSQSLVPQSLLYPLIAKPRNGSSSIGLFDILTQDDLRSIGGIENYILQEKLDGSEYTVNCYVDRQGNLRSAVPHCRIEVRGGEVSKGRTQDVPSIPGLALKLVAALPGLSGAFCFQFFLTKAGPVIFEINARFGGGYPLAHRAGAPFTEWLIAEALGISLAAPQPWKAGVLMLRYDAEVFQ